jgi:opacity protein-like surface antigen
LLSILIAVPAALMSLATTSLAASAIRLAPAESSESPCKYEIYAGYGYTSLNQVDLSRNGLQGVNLSVTRDWGKYFGVAAEGGYYAYPYDATNPGDPSVGMILVGPVVHGPLYKRVGGFAHLLLGGQHTGGDNVSPSVAFAWGAGAGLDYRVRPNIFLRGYGDDISASSVQDPQHLGYSTHTHGNLRVSIGVVYKF